MTVVAGDVLRELGGVARRSAILAVIERKDLERAVAAGDVVRDARGLYALPDAADGVRLANKYGGALALESAALDHGWAVRTVPTKPHVMISRGRRVRGPANDVHLHFAELDACQVVDHVTTEPVTLDHCLRRLPFTDALVVADSALREGFGKQSLRAIADRARGPGAPQARRVAALASGRAANAFESSLRAIAADVPGLNAEPQVRISDGAFAVRPDLVDERLRMVMEADSFEWHGKRSALASDTRRYNMLVVAGWLVLRFCYEDVMFDPDSVRTVLAEAVALAEVLKSLRESAARAA
jgi:very-short-patch-repair endonuclease